MFALSARLGRNNRAARDAWIATQLSKLPHGTRLLDAGAGTQPYRTLCTHLHYVAQDFAAYDGHGDGTALQMRAWHYAGLDVISDIARLPFADATFDAVLCSEVIEHVPAPIAVIAELARVLRPGGELLLTAPATALTHFAPYFFHSGFSRHWYEHHLPAAGLRIVALEANGNYFATLAQELGRVPKVAKTYGGTSRFTRFLLRFVCRVLLALLGPTARRDQGSAELTCFGWHVHAVRDATLDG